MKRTAGLFGVLAVLVAPACLSAQTVEMGPVELEFGGRIQIQFNTTSVDEDEIARPDLVGEIPFSTFETRRVRLTAEVTINDWILGKIQPDYALGRLRLKDAYMDLGFNDAFHLRMGQYKKPFSLVELTTDTKYPTAERGLRIRGLAEAFRADLEEQEGEGAGPPLFTDVAGELLFGDQYLITDALGYLGYDLGVMAYGEIGRLGYWVGMFNGAGPDERDDHDGKNFVVRAEYQPVADWPLVLGAAGTYREFLFEEEVDGVDLPLTDLDGLAIEVDAEWGDFRRPGLHLIAEADLGQNPVGDVDELVPGVFTAVDETFLGVQAVAGFFQPLDGDRVEGIEPVVRVSYGDPDLDTADDEGVLLTPGVNLYFFGRNRIQFNWDVWATASDRVDSANAIRIMSQVHF